MKILNENAEYTSRKKAEKYLIDSDFFKNLKNLDKYGNIECDSPEDSYEKLAIDNYLRIYLREKITSLRSKKGSKYLFGCVRIIHEESLPTSDYEKLNTIVKVISSDEDLYKNIDNNFNDLDFDTIYDKIQDYLAKFGDRSEQENKKKGFENKLYKVVEIENFEESAEYSDYTDWCITSSSYMFSDYSNEGAKTIYYILRNDFKEFPKTAQEWMRMKDDYKYNDAYGTSMICIIVDEHGEMTDSVTRYNHNLTPDSGDAQNAFTEKEIEELLGCNFKDIFVPNPKQNNSFLKTYKKEKAKILDDVMRWFDEVHFGEEKEDYVLDGDYIDFGSGEVYVSCSHCYGPYYEIKYRDSYDYDEEIELSTLYNYEKGMYETPWCENISITHNCALILNDGYYILNLKTSKKLNKNPFYDCMNVYNTKMVLMTDFNHKIHIYNDETGEKIDSRFYYNEMTILQNGYVALGVKLGYGVSKVDIIDTDTLKYVNEKPLYTISNDDRIVKDKFYSSILCSDNKEIKNPYIYDLKTGEKIEIPFYSVFTYTSLYGQMYNTKYGVMNDFGKRNFILDVEEKKVVLELEGSTTKVYDNSGENDTKHKGLIIITRKNSKPTYRILLDNKVIYDNIVALIDEVHLADFNSYSYKVNYNFIMKNNEGKFGLFRTKDFNFYYHPDWKRSWFDNIAILSNSVVITNGDEEKEIDID